jgi:hypothetical protein
MPQAVTPSSKSFNFNVSNKHNCGDNVWKQVREWLLLLIFALGLRLVCVSIFNLDFKMVLVKKMLLQWLLLAWLSLPVDSGARLIGGPIAGADPRGLWQINMAGNLGPDRLRRYGLRNAEDLDDPETNARVMASMLKTDGISAWAAYTDKRYLQYMAEARRMFADVSGGGAIVPASHPDSGNGFTIPNARDARDGPPSLVKVEPKRLLK